jgi:cellulose synthase/poly-beta-1,6-N-acetylglucosamine synthase-like glycosyltransferase
MENSIAITSPVPATPTKEFLDALPSEYDWIVIDDSNGKLNLPKRKNIFIYDYPAQKKILGKFYERYKQLHKSAACRNLAHFLAYKNGYDYAIALDYDCVVPKTFIKDHLAPFEAQKIKKGVGGGRLDKSS